MFLVKVIANFYGIRGEKLMDLDRICLLEFLRGSTGLDWICSGDVICKCMLPWNNKDRLIWCDYALFTKIDHWNNIVEIGKFKPLKFTVQMDN